MNFLPQEEVIGIEKSKNGFKIARVIESQKKSKILELSTVNSLESISKKTVFSVYPQEKTLVRPHTIELVKQKDIEACLSFEIEPLLPYPLDTAIYDAIQIKQSNSETDLVFFSTKKEEMRLHLESLEQEAIEPEAIISKASSLAKFSEHFLPENETLIVLDISEDETACILLVNQKPIVARSISTGLSSLPSEEALENEEVDKLESYLRELSRLFLSFSSYPNVSNKTSVLFTSDGASRPILKALITTFMKQSEVEMTPGIEQVVGYSWQTLTMYASVLGACFAKQKIDNPMQVINFRKGPFELKGFSSRYKKELFTYFSLIVLCSIALISYFLAQEKKLDLLLQQKYTELLALVDEKPSDNIQESLYAIEQKIVQNQDEIQLHPDIPRVSDLLSWLSNHPKASVVVEGEKKEGISLESLHYVLVKRPEKGKTREHYQVRVDLEFSAPSATVAREFHDALLEPNAFIDPKNELKWSMQRGNYRASFFLKDKTHYPQAVQRGYNE